jgi:hypothetical protein
MVIHRRENGIPIGGHTSNGIPLGLKSGTATLISGNTSIVVSHNLGVIPRNINVEPTDGNGTDHQIGTITVTAFTITIPVPQPVNAGFNWSVTP